MSKQTLELESVVNQDFVIMIYHSNITVSCYQEIPRENCKQLAVNIPIELRSTLNRIAKTESVSIHHILQYLVTTPLTMIKEIYEAKDKALEVVNE